MTTMTERGRLRQSKMRQLRRAGWTYAAIARRYRITRQRVFALVNYQ